MSKVEKRLRKSLGPVQNALVIGDGFGLLEASLNVFKSVFVINENKPSIKFKNLIYREFFNDLLIITNISIVFIDRNRVNLIENIEPILYRERPLILIEGNDVIGRDVSGPLYKANYRAIDRQDLYHIWKYQE
jgi:hypothetical protein